MLHRLGGTISHHRGLNTFHRPQGPLSVLSPDQPNCRPLGGHTQDESPTTNSKDPHLPLRVCPDPLKHAVTPPLLCMDVASVGHGIFSSQASAGGTVLPSWVERGMTRPRSPVPGITGGGPVECCTNGQYRRGLL